MEHEERAAGESKYSLYKLIRLNFDLMTGFSVVPLQLFSIFGIGVSIVALAVLRRGHRQAHPAPARRTACSLWDRDILAFFLIGVAALRHRAPGRIRRPHLPAGARAPALPGAGRPARSAKSERHRGRLRLPRRGLPLPFRAARRTACDVPLVVTHRDNPAENIWFGSVGASSRARHGIPVVTPTTRTTPEFVARIAALAPDFLFSFYYRQMLAAGAAGRRPARRLQHARLAAAASTAGACRSTGPCCTARRETGATLHEMVEKPDAGAHRGPGGRAHPARRHGRSRSSARSPAPPSVVLERAPAALARRHAPRCAPQDLRAGQLLRRPQARGRPHRLDAGRARRSTTWCAPWRRPTPARSPRSAARRVRVLRTWWSRAAGAGAGRARRRSPSRDGPACARAAATARWLEILRESRSLATARSSRGARGALCPVAARRTIRR